MNTNNNIGSTTNSRNKKNEDEPICDLPGQRCRHSNDEATCDCKLETKSSNNKTDDEDETTYDHHVYQNSKCNSVTNSSNNKTEDEDKKNCN